KKGLGTDRGGVYLDLSCSPKSPKDIENNLYELMGSVFKYLKNMDIDLVKEKIEVAPAAHYTLGGIRINERCETNILGLFAAGEASGNLHGANRLSGNALAETQVFGKIAGETAAEYARKNPEITLNKNDVLEALEEVESIFVAREKGVKPVEVKRKIKGIMTDYLGFGREEKGLKTALDLLEKIAKEDINSLRLTGNKVFNLDLINALECIFMVDVAKMIVLSALQRQESIGHHYRIDFPENKTCNNQEHTLLKKVQNKIIVKKIPVDKTQWGDIYARENDRY
ncbi:MAG: FAD-binding protein, partial [Clostridia bacterium]|nr:FAD-binding protein [Clostridia bacterium]